MKMASLLRDEGTVEVYGRYSRVTERVYQGKHENNTNTSIHVIYLLLYRVQNKHSNIHTLYYSMIVFIVNVFGYTISSF